MGKSVVGGQAVIEGVLMKNLDEIAIAVRKPNRKITLKKEKFNSLSKRYKFLRWPFLRGTLTLIEMFIFGIKALTFSANESIGEEEEKLTAKEIFMTLTFSLVIAIALFFLLPLFLTNKFTQTEGILFNLVDGIIRVVFVVGYIYLISFMRDMRRLFEYHGAEHKAVNCYEDEKKLTPKNVKRYTTVNPRCGTSFIFFVLVISIIVFSLVPSEIFWVKLISRIVLLPVIAGISYEILRFSDKHKDNILFRMIIAPGLFLQKITTREPNEKQIEVAIKALKAVVKKDNASKA